MAGNSDPTRFRATLPVALLIAGSLLLPASSLAAPFIWDQDEDRIDDRIETVSLLGYEYSFEDADTLMRQRFEVIRVVGDLAYGVYVRYESQPDDQDFDALAALGMPVLHRYLSTPAVRSVATFIQVTQASALPGVERVEAVPLLYPGVREGVAAMGMRDPAQGIFPTWEISSSARGQGIVIAFLDTGINDAPDGSYPGHESLAGRFVGGARFTSSDSTLDTPKGESVNPVDRGGETTNAHGTRMAGVALGSGGETGYARGVAPEARFVDVKVLNDAGVGTGLPEALDWCLFMRDFDWGVPGYEGIDVINVSASSLDQTDGDDIASVLSDQAVAAGIVVVASMGNEGESAYVPSPAGADRVIAVGAFDHQRTGAVRDDLYPSFNNRGPRASDADADNADELKPDLIAAGVGVLSPNGKLAGDGRDYDRSTGTSLSAALVSGAAAALLSAYPGLTPDALATVLRETALRELDVSPGVPGADPRWDSKIGYGAVDLYAALLDLEQPSRTQVRRLELIGNESSVSVYLWTQREMSAPHLVFERAPDAGGLPGAFAAIDSVAATGDASLADDTNLQEYVRNWPVAVEDRGQPFWYRVAYEEGGSRWTTPAQRLVLPVGPRAATLEIVLVHNAYDTDIDGSVRVGPESAPLTFPLPGTSAAVESDWVTGTSTLGNVEWTFRIDVPQGAAEAYLPPSSDDPWLLQLDESGMLNRSGRLSAYRLIWESNLGQILYEGGPAPQQTMEGQSTVATVPSQGIVSVGGPPVGSALRVQPNPVLSGGRVVFTAPRDPGGDLRLFDVAGRQVASAKFQPGQGTFQATWSARDDTGRPLPSGVYYARLGAFPTVRIAVIRP